MELNLVSVIATMCRLESKEYNTSFDRVRFFVQLLILQWKFDLYSDCGLINFPKLINNS